MTNRLSALPFSIAVDLPPYRKSLVERMLQGLQPHAVDVAWTFADPASADVVLRAADAHDISPNLVADVRCADGRVDAVHIGTPWRAGALLDAIQQIAGTLRSGPVEPQALDALAWQWLARWCELAASDARSIEWRVGHRAIGFADPRAGTWTRDEASDADAEGLLAEMAREGFALVATAAAIPATGRQIPLKPLLWQFGVRAGACGPLPALASYRALKLKGWPYLAAGGPRAFAELIAQTRAGTHDAASLCALALAPPALVFGFLNACRVCDFFHDETVAAAMPTQGAAMPEAAARLGAAVAYSKERQTIASIRRVLQADRS